MRLIILSMTVLCSVKVGGGSGDSSSDISFRMETENTSSCRDKNKKTLKEIEDAQLAAHRCMIRDVPVKVPEPEDFIAEYIFPSHIVVPRCSGVCLEKSGFSCHARKKPKLVSHEVVLYSLNGTQVCRNIELEHHKGPCRCSCQLIAAECGPAQTFDSNECRCTCSRDMNPAKYQCAQSIGRIWDDRLCSCECVIQQCQVGERLDQITCKCIQIPTSCQLSPVSIEESNLGAHPARLTTYLGIGALSLVAMTIIATLYFMLGKKRPYGDLRVENSPAVPGPAYTITINQE
ncbi:vascular endothelial growth factor C [Eurytemora carolleeae]|uniref:vascular endothelial growth factor C n=1 Tax=Eurytemora carolleeae TaxID=1294199 RepID=UPI000C765FD9|nr:vascular endothelial growth factor C [Eurytemora carolleeae]|eukprot:XP_023334974.1 vascular endothelial growth factor C-like [Eurytemora affinis]